MNGRVGIGRSVAVCVGGMIVGIGVVVDIGGVLVGCRQMLHLGKRQMLSLRAIKCREM